jgi:hypothetical protein
MQIVGSFWQQLSGGFKGRHIEILASLTPG